MTPATNGSSASPLDRLGLTLGDLEDLEGATGLDVLGLLEKADERLPVSLLIGLVWVTMRRERPGLTLADVPRWTWATSTSRRSRRTSQKGTGPRDESPCRARPGLGDRPGRTPRRDPRGNHRDDRGPRARSVGDPWPVAPRS